MSDQDRSRPTPNWGADDDEPLPRRPTVLGPSPLAPDPPASSDGPIFHFPEPPGSRSPEDRDSGPSVEEELAGFETVPPVEEPYSKDFFEPDEESEPFDRPGTEKLGIIGGRQVGKSFLFQAMVYRTYSKANAGVMSRFLDKTLLFYAMQREDKARLLNLTEFGNKYMSWERLPFTSLVNQQWYRLRLYYRTGILGNRLSSMDVEFFDGSGENFFEAARTRGISKLWRAGYLDARVMVFCLPLWVAFPGSRMTQDDRQERKLILGGFEKVVQNYEALRREGKRTQPVRSILAFTMADDPRSALSTLYERWITPYMDSPQLYLPELGKESGIARYLANARMVSEALHQELAASRDPRVSSIPQRLDFGCRPWLIPLSAVEGKRLDRIERESLHRDELPTPVPVHVELPLLVALCERHNALM